MTVRCWAAAMTSSSSTDRRRGAGAWPLTRLRSASLLVEGGRIAASQPVLALAVALICAGVVLVTLATTGRTVGAERAVLARIEDAGTRAIQVIDDRANPGLDNQILAAISRLDAVSWAIGLGPIEDVRPAGLDGADAVPARRISGSSPELDYPGTTGTGVQAFVATGSQARLGFTSAAGTVEGATGRQYPVVGVFRTSGPLADLGDSILLVGDDESDIGLRRITIEVATAEAVASVAETLRSLVGPGGQGGVTIEVSEDLVLAQSVIRGEFAGFGRAIVLQALAGGLVLMVGAVLAGVNARRRDFGRRRALGASRGQLISLVVAQSLWSALPGVAAGAVAGSALVKVLSGSLPGWEFPMAVAVLTALSAAGAAIVPAILAAVRDPVAALRVP